MDAYAGYVEHNLPLVLLSGLGEREDAASTGPPLPRVESGTRILTTSTECRGDRASQLLERLLAQDGSDDAWNSQALSGPSGAIKYRMRPIGRTYMLPARKAAPLPQSPSAEGFPSMQAAQLRNTELHSPLSPLSPGSPIYPDGVFTPLWTAKHQHQVPALIIAFFQLSAGEEDSQNEQIQIDINAFRTALSRSGFKTRFAVVLMSDKSILHAPELEDRISAIRRATTLDPKTGLFFMPPMSSQAEIATFVQTVLTTLQPLLIEYFRDLTKHARRKKVRGGPSGSITSPVEGGAHALSTPGWNARYEVKQGVFAEFRQEMDVAERHYSAAVDELFNPEGIFEATPSWSPRWEEARLLCDAVALRVIRCQLWTGLTTGAAISWVNYKARMKDLIDRRGKGTQTYSWYAWESRWAEIMSQLIQRASLATLQPPNQQAIDDSVELAQQYTFAVPEKTVPATDRLPPFHLLHHPGYWLRLAIRAGIARREKAIAIPEEDRIPPGQSPASAVAHRSKNYDTYLVPGPHEEYPSAAGQENAHLVELVRLTEQAVHQYELRGQIRATERLKYDLAGQLVDAECYTQAVDLLASVWDNITWREDDWDDLLRPSLVLLHGSAARSGNAEIHLATLWELLSLQSAARFIRQDSLAAYVARSLPKVQKTSVRFENRQRLSPVSVGFAFNDSQTHVGETLECQLVLMSHAGSEIAPLCLSHVLLRLSDGRTITIGHRASEHGTRDKDLLVDLSPGAGDATSAQEHEADLTLPHGMKRVYNCMLNFRDAGTVRLQQVAFVIDNDSFALEHTFSERVLLRSPSVYLQNGDMLEEGPLPYTESTTVTVHPKPPKMQLVLHGLQKQYYVNEPFTLEVELINSEIEAVEATARLSAPDIPEGTRIAHWHGDGASAQQLVVGKIEANATHRATMRITAPSEPLATALAVEVRYNLLSDLSTPLTKSMTIDLSVIAPFAAKYSFGPLLHSGPWPSYFQASSGGLSDEPQGIPQRWRLGAAVQSLAAENLVIRSLKLWESGDVEDAVTKVQDASPLTDHSLKPDETVRSDFEFLTRKLSFDDRRPTTAELSIDVTWSRSTESEPVITTLDVPRLSLPTSEPRVLCTVAEDEDEENALTLQYHLENSSGHFLTFALTMEANDEFAFSGLKYRTLSVAPLSRVRVAYRLLIHEQVDSRPGEAEGRSVAPNLQVVDSYYNKALRVHSGGPRVRVDDKGSLSVLVQQIQD